MVGSACQAGSAAITFSFARGVGVKERPHRRLAEALSSLVRPLPYCGPLDPAIKIDLEDRRSSCRSSCERRCDRTHRSLSSRNRSTMRIRLRALGLGAANDRYPRAPWQSRVFAHARGCREILRASDDQLPRRSLTSPTLLGNGTTRSLDEIRHGDGRLGIIELSEGDQKKRKCRWCYW